MNRLSAFISILRPGNGSITLRSERSSLLLKIAGVFSRVSVVSQPFEAAFSKKCLSVKPRMKGTPGAETLFVLDIPMNFASGRNPGSNCPCDEV